MKTMSVLLAIGLLATGCAGQSDRESTAETGTTEMQGEETIAEPMTSEATEAVTAIVDEAGVVTVAGNVGCGHCNFGIGDHCAAAMKTADGTIYLLEGVDDTPVFTDRKTGKPIEVVGVEKDTDGVRTIVVQTWEM